MLSCKIVKDEKNNIPNQKEETPYAQKTKSQVKSEEEREGV